MIIPRFRLSQNDTHLHIKIRAPYTSSNKIDVNIDKNMFSFNCSPYFLSLQLPGEINENKSEKPYDTFDSDNGIYTFSYEKHTSGQHFEDLEFITKFLVSKSELIRSREDSATNSMEFRYGFGLQYNKPFSHKLYSKEKVFEIDPCNVGICDRRKQRLQIEQSIFDEDEYLNSVEDVEIEDIITQASPYYNATDIAFSDEELDLLKDLDNSNYNLTETQVSYCFNSLIDILFAYCYDRRISCYEENCESDWNITNLAATLSWLDVFSSPKDVIVTCFRRSLIYPLYRNFKLSQRILSDVKELLCLGRIQIIKVLIEIYGILGKRDFNIINKMFIVDYIVYIMKLDITKWQQFVDEVNAVVIREHDLGLNLLKLESVCFSNLRISENDGSDSDDGSCDTDDDTPSNTKGKES